MSEGFVLQNVLLRFLWRPSLPTPQQHARLQAKRRVYTLQSGGKGAAGKRKRSENGSSDGTTAGMTQAEADSSL